jgi:DNA-binding response OmpR family regulator
MEKTKILVVDDDPEITNTLKVILESDGYEVFSATSKDQAEGLIKEICPSLLILDVMMDNMSDGFDLSRDIKSDPGSSKISVILYTAIDNNTGVNFSSAFGNTEMIKADSYLEKPADPQKLLSEVRRLLA